jgi:hypothetical protein
MWGRNWGDDNYPVLWRQRGDTAAETSPAELMPAPGMLKLTPHQA